MKRISVYICLMFYCFYETARFLTAVIILPTFERNDQTPPFRHSRIYLIVSFKC